MKYAALFLTVLLMTTAAYAQVSVGGGIITLPTPGQGTGPLSLPVLFPFSNSVIDHDGNVLIIETQLYGIFTGMLAPSPQSSKTHIAVVSSDGKTKNGYDYDGYFQVVGVGLNAVYAIETSIPATSTASVRRVVALRVVAGTLPTTLPSVPASGDVKLSPGTGSGDPDRLALIDSVFLPVLSAGGTGGTSPISFTHKVNLYTSDGASFTANPNNPISAQ
jgi:hypothetical protein